MGSFANSLHVKSGQARDVIESIESVMRTSGYAPTEENPGRERILDEPSPVRGLHVGQAHNGWVAVLDSQFYHSESLAIDLSQHLKTHVLQFMVHDSDSWYYQLFYAGKSLDTFTSSDEPEGINESGNPAYRQRLNELAQPFSDDVMPDEMRAIRQRMMYRKPVSEEESMQLREWVMAYTQQLYAELQMLKSEGTPASGETAAARTDLQPHLERLRPIMPKETTETQVLEILGKREVFAEKALWEFMGLLGIQPFFASLSYAYLEECNEEELLAEGIHISSHLKFKAGSISDEVG